MNIGHLYIFSYGVYLHCDVLTLGATNFCSKCASGLPFVKCFFSRNVNESDLFTKCSVRTFKCLCNDLIVLYL